MRAASLTEAKISKRTADYYVMSFRVKWQYFGGEPDKSSEAAQEGEA
jgi:hypothetical protein